MYEPIILSTVTWSI